MHGARPHTCVVYSRALVVCADSRKIQQTTTSILAEDARSSDSNLCNQVHNSYWLLASHSAAHCALCWVPLIAILTTLIRHSGSTDMRRLRRDCCIYSLRRLGGDPLAMRPNLSCRYLNYLSVNVRFDYIERARTRAPICCQNHNPVVVPTTYEASRHNFHAGSVPGSAF